MKSPLSQIIFLMLCFCLIMMNVHLVAGAAENEDFDETTLEGLEETSLDILLIGTAPGGENMGFAIILDNRTDIQKICRVGDSIDNAEIKRVYRKQVVLEVNGQNQVLSFADPRQIERVPIDQAIDVVQFNENIIGSTPEVFIVRDAPSKDQTGEKPKLRKIIFTSKQNIAQ